MFGGIPAFGAGRMSGSIEKAGTLTHHEGRNDLDSETFFVQPDVIGAFTSYAYSGGAGGRPEGAAAGHFLAVAGALRSTDGGADVDHALAGHLVAGTLNANGKAAGSATNQDAEPGLLVVHGTQDPGVSQHTAFALGRNNGQENAVCVTGDITHTLKAEGFDGSEDGTGRGQPIVSVLRGISDYGQGLPSPRSSSGDAGGGSEALVSSSSVRRLIPRECERLQGMANDYTQIPWRGKPASECPDGPRYKAIGNSKAVSVVRWIGRRLLQQFQS